MSKLIHSPEWIKDNLLLLVGLSLCFYFAYHLMQGERSLTRMLYLQKEVSTLSSYSDTTGQQRLALEKKVKMMRPGSIDRDLLEEQARLVLGYKYVDEITIVSY